MSQQQRHKPTTPLFPRVVPNAQKPTSQPLRAAFPSASSSLSKSSTRCSCCWVVGWGGVSRGRCQSQMNPSGRADRSAMRVALSLTQTHTQHPKFTHHLVVAGALGQLHLAPAHEHHIFEHVLRRQLLLYSFIRSIERASSQLSRSDSRSIGSIGGSRREPCPSLNRSFTLTLTSSFPTSPVKPITKQLWPSALNAAAAAAAGVDAMMVMVLGTCPVGVVWWW